jgi:CubicO group peptidase (beta-lactamase class C family)
VHGFPGYRADTPLLPTLVQILDGVAPANTHPVRIVEQPGLKCRYSGGGFTVLQLLIEDVTGNSFANLTKELVFSPLDMTNSTYQIMRPTDETANFSSGHDKFGKEITGQWHLYPESAAAGLWSTAIDLAKFVMEIQSSVNGQSRLGLSAKYAQLMTQPQVENNALGFKVDESKRFFHTGSNEGFRALLAAKGPGKGVVAMTNGENGEEIRKMVFEEIQSQIGF